MYLSRRGFITWAGVAGALAGLAFLAGGALASVDRAPAGDPQTAEGSGPDRAEKPDPGEVAIDGQAPEIPADAIPLDASADVVDGDGEVVGRLSCRYILSSRERQILVSYALQNTCDEAITSLRFEITYRDASGSAPRGKAVSVTEFFQDVPVEAGKICYFEHEHFFDGAETAVSVELAEVRSTRESELPRWTEPKPGNDIVTFCNDPELTARFDDFPQNPPVRVELQSEGALGHSTEDPDLILLIGEAVRTVRIGEPVNRGAADAGTGLWFYEADGSSWGFYFEDADLFSWHGRNYAVETWGDFAEIEIPVDPDMPVYGGS